MRRLAFSLLAILVIGAALNGIVPALAQDAPPARVGRVSFVAGQLGFHLAGETAWSAAKPNYPVATGGSFWTDPKSRAELRVGSRTISLAGDTELDVTKLDQQVMQLAVSQGRINLRVRTLLEGESIEVDLPRGAVWVLQPGIYDIDAGGPDQPERVAVFEGSARFVGGSLDVAINAGDAAVISGTQTLASNIERATTDDFTKWCRSRDYDERRLASAYYVSPQMTGYEELDEYGAWRDSPQYGRVWFPRRVGSGWAPYREGHWVWMEPWGWSWVDDEPWGFAPFHYGRWAMVDDQWGWVPGEFAPMPVYAPALVAFVGDPGAGYWDAANVGPAVGWFPLGPGEVYWPSYTRDASYIRNVNITNVNVTTINQVTSAAGANRGAADPPPQVVNQSFANRAAATIVPAKVFANAAPVAPAARQIPQQVVQQAAKQMPVSVRPPQLTPVVAKGPANAAGPRGPATAGTPAGPATATAPIGPGKGREPGGPGLATAPTAPGKGHEPGPTAAPGVAHVPPPAGGPGRHEIPAATAPSAVTGPEHKAGPGIAHAPPALPNAAPPNAASGPAPGRPGHFEAAREPPPSAVHGPMRMGPQPQAVHTPPPAMKEPPHAAPPQAVHAAPPAMREPPHMPPPQAVHMAPPPAPHPAPAPPPAQVFRGAPPTPPPAPHPAPAPPPQIAHAPPAPPPQPAARPAAPPAPAAKGAPPAKGSPPGKEEKH